MMPGATSLRWTVSTINVAETERFQLVPQCQIIKVSVALVVPVP